MKKSILLIILFKSLMALSQPFNHDREWATYLDDDSMRVLNNEIDRNGNIVLVGYVNQLDYHDSSFLTTANAHQTQYGGAKSDGFIVKLDSSGNIVWSTYFGGGSGDYISGLAVDKNNHIFIIGGTSSTTGIATQSSYQNVLLGGSDSFIAKFSSDGVLQWSTYYGGLDNNQPVTLSDDPGALAQLASDIVCDDFDNIYFHNGINSPELATPDAFQSGFIGNQNTDMISKFTSDGQRVWATYYGINGSRVRGIALNTDGLFISGVSLDCIPTYTYNTYFATSGSHQSEPGDCRDIFISKFSFAGERLWSSYYGSSAQEFMGKNSIVTSADRIIIAGSTSGIENIATPGSFQETKGIGFTNFIAKFNTNGSREWGTYYGTSGNFAESQNYPSINSDIDNNLYLSGNNQYLTNLSTTNSYQEIIAGSKDAYTAKFSSTGERLWSTYYGGINYEAPALKTLVDGETFYITGMTASHTNISTPGSLQESFQENSFISNIPVNIYVAKFGPAPLSTTEQFKADIQLFPNPVSDILYLKLPEKATNEYHYEIFDMMGRIILNHKVLDSDKINVANLHKGNYLLKLQYDDQITFFNFIKL